MKRFRLCPVVISLSIPILENITLIHPLRDRIILKKHAQAEFYDTNIYQYPAGYLVHNLEHGYIIFWYNCGLLDEAACIDLKSQMKSVMNEFKNVKVVAYHGIRLMSLL